MYLEKVTLYFAMALVFVFTLAPSVMAADAARGGNEQHQALVALVYDQSCKISCGIVRPKLKQLEDEYAGRVQFVELDVSKDCLKESEKTAKSLGILSYLQDTEDWYPAVVVFSSRRKKVKELLGPRNITEYRAAIEKAMAAN